MKTEDTTPVITEQLKAEIDAVYAGRPLSRVPRESIHNFIKSMERLLS